jgi:hypothetical protein
MSSEYSGSVTLANSSPRTVKSIILGAYHALLSTFTSAKQTEHLRALVTQTDALVLESSKLRVLTGQLKWLTFALVAFAGIDFIRFGVEILPKLFGSIFQFHQPH